MTTKTIRLSAFLAIGLIFISPMALANAAGVDADSDIALADPSRYNIEDVEVYLEYDYNKTLLDTNTILGIGAMSLPQYTEGTHGGMIGVFSGMIEDDTNITDAGDFIDVEGASDTSNANALNASGSDIQEYSSALYADIDNPVDEASTRAVGQKMANTDETDLDYFNDEETIQYRVWESIDISDIEAEVASDLKRAWNESYIDLVYSEVIVTLNWDNMKLMLDAYMAHEDYSETEMDDADVASLMEKIFPDYMRGMHFGAANETEVSETTEERSTSEELISTLNNDSDATLHGFRRSVHVGNGFAGYLLENYDALTSAVAMGQFGKINSLDFGVFSGLELVYNNETGTTSVKTGMAGVMEGVLDSITGIGHGGQISSAAAHTILSFMEMMNFKAIDVEAGEIPWLGIYLTALIVWLLGWLITFGFNWDKAINWANPTYFEKGDKKTGVKIAGKTFRVLSSFFILVWLLSGFYG